MNAWNWLRRLGRGAGRDAAETLLFLDRWQMKATADGALQIKPAGPTLSHTDLCDLVQRLRHAPSTRGMTIVFDFSAIEAIESPWTLVFALLIDFHKRAGGPCQVSSLRGQPADVASIVLSGLELSKLRSERGAA